MAAHPLMAHVSEMVGAANTVVVASLGEKPVSQCSQLELAEGIRARLLGIEDPSILAAVVRMMQDRMGELRSRARPN